MMPSYSFTNLPLTLHALLDLRAAELQDQIYVNLKGRSLSYGQLASYSLDLAARLKQVGVMTGDRVMLLMPASEYHLSLWFALSRISAVEVPVNPAYKGALLRQLIETAAPSLCIIDDEYLEEFKDFPEWESVRRAQARKAERAKGSVGRVGLFEAVHRERPDLRLLPGKSFG